MSKTIDPGAPGAATPLVSEIQAALGGFVKEIKGFQENIDTKMKQTEERLTMLDRKSHQAARPHLAASDDAAPHQKAFGTYVRSGDDDALRGLDMEGKALNTANNLDGGFLVDPQTSERVASVLRSTSSLRSVANVVHVEATSYDFLIDRTDLGSGWANETDDTTETGTPRVDRISIPLNELSALPKASQRLLDDSAFDVEGWLAERIADRFARAEATAFISGSGVERPRGILNHTAVPAATAGWNEIGYVVTGADGDLASPDPLLDLVYTLGASYRANATFVMNSKTTSTLRKLKDADGRFLWSDGLASGEPARLLGYPVLIAEDMPDIATDSYSIAFGDFKAGYTIAERPDLRVLRDPFSAKPHVLFYATKRVGGDVTDFEAIKLLKFGLT
jgi:HK97 family phage major capsid protein